MTNFVWKARARAAKALKEGEIKQEPCAQCANPDTVMHHRDYEQPLMIVWLCRSCHRREHIDIRNGRLDYPAERQSKSVEYTGVQVNLWMEAEDRELLRKAARLAGHNTSSYTRHVAIIQARKDLALSKGLTPRRPRAAHAR